VAFVYEGHKRSGNVSEFYIAWRVVTLCIKFQNFHFFAQPLCQKALRQRLRTGFILQRTGPLKFWPQAPLGDPPPKIFFPNFPKILRVVASFSSALYGDPKAH